MGATLGQLTHHGIVDARSGIVIAAFMAATNVGVTKTCSGPRSSSPRWAACDCCPPHCSPRSSRSLAVRSADSQRERTTMDPPRGRTGVNISGLGEITPVRGKAGRQPKPMALSMELGITSWPAARRAARSMLIASRGSRRATCPTGRAGSRLLAATRRSGAGTAGARATSASPPIGPWPGTIVSASSPTASSTSAQRRGRPGTRAASRRRSTGRPRTARRSRRRAPSGRRRCDRWPGAPRCGE